MWRKTVCQFNEGRYETTVYTSAPLNKLLQGPLFKHALREHEPHLEVKAQKAQGSDSNPKPAPTSLSLDPITTAQHHT